VFPGVKAVNPGARKQTIGFGVAYSHFPWWLARIVTGFLDA